MIHQLAQQSMAIVMGLEKFSELPALDNKIHTTPHLAIPDAP